MAMRNVIIVTALVAAILVAGAVAIVALVGDEDDDEEAGTTPGSSPVAQTTVAPTPTAPVPGTPGPAPSPPAPDTFGFGEPATDEEIVAINIDIPPNGEGLPPGSGTPEEGEAVYAEICAACHGQTGREGGIGGQLVSEPGPWQEGMPKTIGSYWPYATTVYDYVNRAMPFDRPGTLTPDQVYAVTAYLLRENQIIADDQEMNAETLPQVQMPNQPSFYPCWPDECREPGE